MLPWWCACSSLESQFTLDQQGLKKTFPFEAALLGARPRPSWPSASKLARPKKYFQVRKGLKLFTFRFGEAHYISRRFKHFSLVSFVGPRLRLSLSHRVLTTEGTPKCPSLGKSHMMPDVKEFLFKEDSCHQFGIAAGIVLSSFFKRRNEHINIAVLLPFHLLS
jgi:hypothetical protein